MISAGSTPSRRRRGCRASILADRETGQPSPAGCPLSASLPGRASYHAAKHGVVGLTGSAALEYAPRGIRINAVCPGIINTPMVSDMIEKGELDLAESEASQPIARLGTAEEIAQAVLWLCSPGASFVVGVALPVDGGYVAQ
ncbi:SDR family oxidoreductase [Amycolatopsis sp. 195334CR]|uniref:SDR family oxidoreductase n=1 Tax=Amycolatopsis sp. 195334CR TaxID=2814588 RepID=UPI0027DE69B5|nr:SDR family oxidoreductase [Amycolatopsis sp. 195334CR]